MGNWKILASRVNPPPRIRKSSGETGPDPTHIFSLSFRARCHLRGSLAGGLAEIALRRVCSVSLSTDREEKRKTTTYWSRQSYVKSERVEHTKVGFLRAVYLSLWKHEKKKSCTEYFLKREFRAAMRTVKMFCFVFVYVFFFFVFF